MCSKRTNRPWEQHQWPTRTIPQGQSIASQPTSEWPEKPGRGATALLWAVSRSHTRFRRTEAGSLKPIPDTVLFYSNLMTNLDSVLKTKDITLLTKVCIVKAMVFPVVMYQCESWTIKIAENWCFWTVVLKKTPESPLGCKEIKSVNPKGNQFWIFIGRTDAEAEASIFWPPDVKNWLMWKDAFAGKDWRQE